MEHSWECEDNHYQKYGESEAPVRAVLAQEDEGEVCGEQLGDGEPGCG